MTKVAEKCGLLFSTALFLYYHRQKMVLAIFSRTHLVTLEETMKGRSIAKTSLSIKNWGTLRKTANNNNGASGPYHVVVTSQVLKWDKRYFKVYLHSPTHISDFSICHEFFVRQKLD
jgi:hypothetical protein